MRRDIIAAGRGARLVLVARTRLVNLLLDHEGGVSTQLYKVPRIDSDYFDESLG